MKQIPIENVRTIVLAGHGSSGKTSIIENLLFTTGANTRIGRVDDGTSLCDNQDDEKKRKITINSKVQNIEFQDHSLFICDTPGYADFFGDTLSAFRASDCALIVVDATAGIQVGTMKTFKEADRLGMPRAFLINKLDKSQANYKKTVDALRETFGTTCAPLHIPIGQGDSLKGIIDIVSGKGLDKADDAAKTLAEESKTKLLDAIAETDDALLEKYLGGETLTADEIAHGFQKGIVAGTIMPILCASAEKAIGIEELLDALAQYFPSPKDVGEKNGKEDGQCAAPDPTAPFSAFVFKSVTDPFIGHLTYFRVFSGKIGHNAEVQNISKGKREKLGHLYIMRGKDQIEIGEATPGDIVVVPKLKYTTINDTFCAGGAQIEYPEMVFPKPTLSFSLHAKQKGDEEKIATGLSKLSDDDPTLTIVKNAETKQMILSGLGDIHIDVMLERLKLKFNVEVEIGKPKVAYKETCRSKAKGHEKHKKQSGGRGQYGDVYLEIEPLESGTGFEFVDKIVGGVIPKGFLPAIEKGIKGAMEDGIIAGYPVVDVRAIVYDGSYHTVDSSEIAFKIAGSKAFKEAFLAAKPVLLEPIMNIEITVPEEFTGTIMGDLTGKRGRVQGMETTGHMEVIRAQIPSAEIFTYSNEIRSMTGGRGSFTMEFSHYEEVPAHLSQKVIDEAKAEKEAAHA